MFQIVSVALISAIIIIYLKSINSDLYVLASVGAGLILISFVLKYVSESFAFINQIIEMTGINKDFYLIIFKITAIGYLVEFGADTINDLGLKGLAEKLIFVGKVVIFATSLPILYAVFNLLVGLMQ
ncbi:MAG: hypothetical protein IJX03_03045 [Clostridia bacterium]|nr:hypothetical protein [Clostridia bacterium]